MRNPAPHPVPSIPHPSLVNGTTSRPSRPATALVACETVGRSEGFRLGHLFEKPTKELRVSQWAETTVACVYDPRCPSLEMQRALCEVTAGLLKVREYRHVGMVHIYTCCHAKDEPTCMTPHEFHACALEMLTTQRRYPTWLPIPSILVEEPGKVMYGDHAFSIQVREREVADCLVSIAAKIMHIVAASIDASNLARLGHDSPLPASPSPLPEPMGDPNDDTTPPPSPSLREGESDSSSMMEVDAEPQVADLFMSHNDAKLARLGHDFPLPASPSPLPEPMGDPNDDTTPPPSPSLREGESDSSSIMEVDAEPQVADLFMSHNDAKLARCVPTRDVIAGR
ncbi:hypothetical protein CYMTET_55640 [Cymbomonas tetramitiformis]|uniref:Uncharacterized protein n=1 Tax=Cymbomonas tetramitiformis TaxID=36881 RepID=A0AAE0BCJ7_9CHLO|nr:hypothetical protein CYMTET_55640 [Cymbomonas tetramitiformis]